MLNFTEVKRNTRGDIRPARQTIEATRGPLAIRRTACFCEKQHRSTYKSKNKDSSPRLSPPTPTPKTPTRSASTGPRMLCEQRLPWPNIIAVVVDTPHPTLKEDVDDGTSEYGGTRRCFYRISTICKVPASVSPLPLSPRNFRITATQTARVHRGIQHQLDILEQESQTDIYWEMPYQDCST